MDQRNFSNGQISHWDWEMANVSESQSNGIFLQSLTSAGKQQIINATYNIHSNPDERICQQYG